MAWATPRCVGDDPQKPLREHGGPRASTGRRRVQLTPAAEAEGGRSVDQLIAPGGFGVRFDSHVAAGYVVPPHYDSLIGKLIVHQPTRGEAIETMTRALRELQVKGIATTAPLHLDLLAHSAFHDATIDTKFVERLLAE